MDMPRIGSEDGTCQGLEVWQWDMSRIGNVQNVHAKDWKCVEWTCQELEVKVGRVKDLKCGSGTCQELEMCRIDMSRIGNVQNVHAKDWKCVEWTCQELEVKKGHVKDLKCGSGTCQELEVFRRDMSRIGVVKKGNVKVWK